MINKLNPSQFSQAQLRIDADPCRSGTFLQTGGFVRAVSGYGLEIGEKGTYTQTGGTLQVTAENNFHVDGIYNLSGEAQAQFSWLSVSQGGVVNQRGGDLWAEHVGAMAGTYKLSGGIFYAEIYVSPTADTSVFNQTGGTALPYRLYSFSRVPNLHPHA